MNSIYEIVAPAGQQARSLYSDAKFRCQVSGVREAAC